MKSSKTSWKQIAIWLQLARRRISEAKLRQRTFVLLAVLFVGTGILFSERGSGGDGGTHDPTERQVQSADRSFFGSKSDKSKPATVRVAGQVKSEQLDALLQEFIGIIYPKDCVDVDDNPEGHSAICQTKLRPDLVGHVGKICKLMVDKDVSDQHVVGAINFRDQDGVDRRLKRIAEEDVDAAKVVLYYIYEVAERRRSPLVQNAAADLLIDIVHHVRPKSKPKSNNPDEGSRGYWIPAETAIDQLKRIYIRNAGDDQLTEKIVNAMAETALRDTATDSSGKPVIYPKARDFLASTLGQSDPAYSFEFIDCERQELAKTNPAIKTTGLISDERCKQVLAEK